MKCEEAVPKLIDYIDKNLDDSSRQELEMHLGTCEKCMDELKESRQITQLISKEEMLVPDDSVRINFYHMLHSEIKKSEKNISSSSLKQINNRLNISWMRIAAGVALLITGTFIGLLIHSGSVRSGEIKQLRAEVSELKKNSMFTMLNQVSSSDRIMAVSYAEDLVNPDQNIIDVLVKTLNYDKNVNVRMAAAYALSKFADQGAVCDSLVKSLAFQEDPILQITLINILAERREKSAFKTIQDIISNKNTINEVRVVAQNSLGVLI